MLTNIFVFSCITLIVVPLLLVTSEIRKGFIIYAGASFLSLQLLFTVALENRQFYRASSMERVLQGLLRDPSPAAELVLVGSSYSSRGIDGDLLQNRISNQGYPINVKQLTWPGSFAYENDFYLDRYLDEVAEPPEHVLLELGTEHSIDIDEDNFMSSSLVRFHDTERTVYMLKQGLFGQQNRNILERLNDTSEISSHFLTNLFNVGIIGHLEPAREVDPRTGYQPENLVPNASAINKLREGLRARHNEKTDTIRTPHAEVAFRKKQIKKLKERGIKNVIFFTPPYADSQRRQTVRRLCVELRPNCILADEKLYSMLEPTLWTDMGHLNRKGSNVLTEWLAHTLIENRWINQFDKNKLSHAF